MSTLGAEVYNSNEWTTSEKTVDLLADMWRRQTACAMYV